MMLIQILDNPYSMNFWIDVSVAQEILWVGPPAFGFHAICLAFFQKIS